MSKANFDKNKRKFYQTFVDAFRGILHCIKAERNMRIHTVFAVYVLFFSAFMQLSRVEFAIILLVIGIMMTAEAVNTAIERICDFICPNFDKRIGIIKDVAAGGALISAIFAVFVGIAILYKPVQIMIIVNFLLLNWWYLILLAISLIFAVRYIVGKK